MVSFMCQLTRLPLLFNQILTFILLSEGIFIECFKVHDQLTLIDYPT